MSKPTDFLFKKIKLLYPTFEMPDELDIEAWTENLAGYSQTEILDALKEYRKTVEYNTPPTPAGLKKYLRHSDTQETVVANATVNLKYHAPAAELMAADIAAGDCKHLLPVYKLAVAYVTEDMLLTEIPAEVWRKMSFSRRWNMAVDKGLFNNFRQILCDTCQREYGKPYQFPSENELIAAGQMKQREDVSETVASLAAHWRA